LPLFQLGHDALEHLERFFEIWRVGRLLFGRFLAKGGFTPLLS